MTNREIFREIYSDVKVMREDITQIKEEQKNSKEEISLLKKSTNKWFERGINTGIATVFSSIIHFFNK